MLIKKFLFIISFSLFFNSLTLQAETFNVAFYSDFEPISYSANRDPSHPQFNEANGYEIDLLKAIEKIPQSNMTFKFHGVKEWDQIWLLPATHPTIDISIGGITREDKRLLNPEGLKVVATTHKTLHFKQSLLMNNKNSTLIKNHEDLTCSYIIGAVRGTTGEYRYLAQSNIINNIDDGLLKKGMTVILEDKKFITSDGSLSIYDPQVSQRSMIIPPDCSLPITKYFIAEDSMIPILNAGHIDAIARGYIGNKLVADKSDGKLVVNAIYSLECPKQESITCTKKEEAVFFVKLKNTQLLAQLNFYIDYLTDNGKIEYDDWKNNPNIFYERAQTIPHKDDPKKIGNYDPTCA